MARASGSACGRPPGAVTARPTTLPSLTITQPTDGLGQLLPSPRRASPRAARICEKSSITPLCGLAQLAEKGLEVLGLAEVAIDRGEADIGDGVDLLERLHHHFTDVLAGDV